MQIQPNKPEQLRLPGIEFTPPKVRAHGLREAHTRPLVSRGKKSNGTHGASWRVPAASAWQYPEVELRAGNSWPCLVLDMDGANALERLVYNVEKGNVLEPNWAVTRKDGGGTHAVWTLAQPVHRGASAKAKPIRALSRVSEFYSHTLEADPDYRGVLSHNPMSAAHGPQFVTNWLHRKPYRLAALAEVIPFGWTIPTVRETAVGRNCALFDALMRFAGSPDNAGHDLFSVAMAINQQFPKPLERVSEVRGIARSVEKYRARWTYYTPEQRVLWGRDMGIRSARSRRERNSERDKGIVWALDKGRTYRAIAKEWKLSTMAVWNIHQRSKA